MHLFEQWLHQYRKVSMEIVLSSSYVRTMILPWSAELHGDTEWREFAKRRLSVSSGSEVLWDISLDRYRYGAARLAFAMHSGQRARLQQILRQGGVRARCIQPNWVNVMNQHSGIDGVQTIVIVTEDTGFSLVAIKDGEWIHTRAFQHRGSVESTQEMVNRERIIVGFTRDTKIFYLKSDHGDENALVS